MLDSGFSERGRTFARAERWRHEFDFVVIEGGTEEIRERRLCDRRDARVLLPTESSAEGCGADGGAGRCVPCLAAREARRFPRANAGGREPRAEANVRLKTAD